MNRRLDSKEVGGCLLALSAPILFCIGAVWMLAEGPAEDGSNRIVGSPMSGYGLLLVAFSIVLFFVGIGILFRRDRGHTHPEE